MTIFSVSAFRFLARCFWPFNNNSTKLPVKSSPPENLPKNPPPIDETKLNDPAYVVEHFYNLTPSQRAAAFLANSLVPQIHVTSNTHTQNT